MTIKSTLKSFLKGKCTRRQRSVLLRSPCKQSVCHRVPVDRHGAWKSFCVVCKRPLIAEPLDTEEVAKSEIGTHKVGRYAYVVVLYGANPGFVLGAMVLARSLRKSGTVHDLLLLHTSSVPPAAVELLRSASWKPHEVELISGVKELFDHDEPRFRDVFTKLHVMALYEYEKVLCMDIDTLVIQNMDRLFDLEAPAATGRGAQDTYNHGDPIDGSSFFRGGIYGNPSTSWGQSWGINAGVMLLRPSKAHFEQMLLEVLDSQHPSHIGGKGPEQDYLSRYFASCWKHIGVEYNFQLHQMFFILASEDFKDARPRLMRQFLSNPTATEIHLLHYSGGLKPWDRFLDKEYMSDAGQEGDRQFLQSMLESWTPYWLWVKKDPATVKHKGRIEGVMLGYDEKLYWTSNWEPVNISESLVQAAETVVAKSLTWWNEAYHELGAELGLPGQDLATRVGLLCNVANGASTCIARPRRGWESYEGWWVEHPVSERASIIAGCFPCPFATVTASDRTLLDVRGASANGVYAVALSSNHAPLVYRSDDNTSGWAEQVPHGSSILLAFVAMPQRLVADFLQTLVRAGFGALPTKVAVPANCSVLVIAGQKGSVKWSDAVADMHFAKATLPLPPNVLFPKMLPASEIQ